MKTTGIAVALACAAICLGSPACGAEAEYTATSLFRINREEPALLGHPVRHESDKEFDIYKKTQRQLVKSALVLLPALRKPEVAKLPAVRRQTEKGDAVRWLATLVKVEFPDNAEIMSVSVTTSDPQEAATLARAVTDAYLKEVVNAEREQKRQRLDELDRAYVEKDSDVRGKRLSLKKLAEALQTSDGETLTMTQKLALEELAASRKEMRQIKTELRVFQRDLAVQKALLPETAAGSRDAIAKEIKRLEVSIAVTTEQLSAITSEVDNQLKKTEKFGSSVPEVEMMRAEIKNLEAVSAEIAVERERLKMELRAAPRVTLLQPAEAPESKD